MGVMNEDRLTLYDGLIKTHITNTTVAKETGKGLSTNDYTTTEKNKLAGIADGANKTVVDSALNTSSTNPVQNKVIAGEINTLKKSVSDGKTLVATAITDKGVNTAADATFAVMAENIGQIETGGGELHGATISVTTTEETLIGKTIKLSLNSTTVDTKTFDSNGACSFTDIQEAGTYSLYSTDGTDSATIPVDITAENVVNKTVISCEFYLTPDGETITPVDDVAILLKCAEIKDKSYTTMDELLADEQAMGDITMSENAMKYLARSTGFADAVCANETFMTLLGQSAYVDATVLNSDLWISKIKASPYKWLVLEKPVYPFSTASDADLAKMLDAYYNGDITIDDIKTKNSVGDARSVQLASMEATGVGEEQPQQNVEFVIIGFSHDDLVTPINGVTKAALTIQTKESLYNSGYVHDDVNNNSLTWSGTKRHTWCNNVFLNSLPTELKENVKLVNKPCGGLTGNSSRRYEELVQTKVFLVSFMEVFGLSTWNSSTYGTASYANTNSDGKQYEYYKVIANRVKNINYHTRTLGSSWGEVMGSSSQINSYVVTADGTGILPNFRGSNYINTDNGIVPALCL